MKFNNFSKNNLFLNVFNLNINIIIFIKLDWNIHSLPQPDMKKVTILPRSKMSTKLCDPRQFHLQNYFHICGILLQNFLFCAYKDHTMYTLIDLMWKYATESSTFCWNISCLLPHSNTCLLRAHNRRTFPQIFHKLNIFSHYPGSRDCDFFHVCPQPTTPPPPVSSKATSSGHSNNNRKNTLC